MQKSAWVASLDLLGRSDPRLFVREIEKRSSDLCKRMQVASAAAATHRCDQLWRRVKIAVPGAAVVSRPFSLLPFDVFVPRFPFFPNLSFLSLSLPRFALFVDEHPLFASYGTWGGRDETEGARWCLWMSGLATVHRPIDCRKWSTDSKATSSLSLFPISSLK